MTAKLTNPQLQAFVHEQVRQGRFGSTDEVLEAAVEHLMLEEAVRSLTPADVAAIAEGDADIARGDVVDFDDFAAAARRKFKVA